MQVQEKSIANSATSVLVIIIVSKIVGFLQSALVAAYFGTSTAIDLFYMAGTIANKFVFTLFSGISIIGLTMYNSARTESPLSGSRFITALIIYMIPASLVASAIIFFAAPFIAKLMANNYSGNEIIVLTKYIRELSLVAVFYVLTTIFTCVLNAHKKFMPGAMIGIIQNGTMIAFILMLSEELKVNSIILGFITAYIIQTVFLYAFASKICPLSKCSLKNDIDIKRIIILLLPLILGEATAEINMLVDQYLATMQGGGGVSALTYSGTLNDVVTALFIQTITTVLLSYFSSLAVFKKFDEMLAELKSIIKMVTLILVPVSIVTVICADNIVSFVFERGEFDGRSVAITSLALMGYGFGFIFKSVMVIVKRPFFAIENTRIPMAIGIITVIVNIALSTTLSFCWGLLGITIATSISYIVACGIYFYKLSSTFSFLRWKDCYPFMRKIFVATVITTSVTYISDQFEFNQNFLNLVFSTCICFTIYVVVLYFLRLNELNVLYNKIQTVINKCKF